MLNCTPHVKKLQWKQRTFIWTIPSIYETQRKALLSKAFLLSIQLASEPETECMHMHKYVHIAFIVCGQKAQLVFPGKTFVKYRFNDSPTLLFLQEIHINCGHFMANKEPNKCGCYDQL